MKILSLMFVAASVLCGCSPKSDAPEDNRASTLPSVERMELPPQEYRGDYTTLSSVITLPDDRLREVCGSDHALACAGREGSFDVMYLPNPCRFPTDPYAALLCHEMAHLQGWSHDASADAARCQGVMILDDSCRAFAKAELAEKLAAESPSERAEREERWGDMDARIAQPKDQQP